MIRTHSNRTCRHGHPRAGELTAITYTDDDGVSSTVQFVVHPGDVNANGITDGNDILAFVDGPRHLCVGPRIFPDHGTLYRSNGDINRDGVLNNRDLLELIGLLVGAGAYEPWLGSVVPNKTEECP